jgi:FtsH-binding integral membrane protein
MRRFPLAFSSAPIRWTTLGVSAIGAALPLVALAAFRPSHQIRATAAWGALILISFAGWGDLAKRNLAPRADVDWGLRAAWGLAVTVAVGGLFCFLGLARAPVLVAWICGGVALFAQALLFGRRPPGASAVGSGDSLPRATPLGWESVLAAGVVCATAFIYLSAAGHTFPNPSDDWPAYLPLVRKLLQTGTLVEPFSVRRMAAYGGQTLLQALTLVVAEDTQIQNFDGGICLVLTIGLIFGFAREARNVSWTLLLLTAVSVLMLPDGRANSASEMSGVVGFVALWRTATLVERRRLRGLGPALLVALPAAAVATLRQNYLLTVAIALGALVLRGDGARASDGARDRTGEQAQPAADRRRFFRQVALLTGACLLPWALLAVWSNHTFLFPIVHGNFHPESGGISVPTTWDLRLRAFFSAMFHDEPIHPLPLVLIALPAVAAGANRRASLGLWLGTMVGFAYLCWSLPNSDNYTIARYVFAYVVGLVIVAGLAAAEGADGAAARSGRGLTAVGLVATALALQIYGTHAAAVKSLNTALDRIRADASPSAVTATPQLEQRMQAAVPPGAPLLVMIDRPYLLDFARNPIEILDEPGAASPAPGIPLTEGAEKVALYLRAQGIRYVGFVRPDKAVSPIYSRAQWLGMLNGSAPLWHATAPFNLAAFDVVGQFAQRHRRLYDDGRLVLVDLAVNP